MTEIDRHPEHPSTAGAEVWIGLYDADQEADAATVVYVKDSHPWRPVSDLVEEVAGSVFFLAGPFDDAYSDCISDASLLVHLLRMARGAT